MEIIKPFLVCSFRYPDGFAIAKMYEENTWLNYHLENQKYTSLWLEKPCSELAYT